MKPTEVLHELRLVQKKFKDEKPYTFGLRISDMAKDAADALEEVMMMDGEWIPVEMILPPSPEYDWVLVRVKLMPEGYYGVPHVAELRDGVWYESCGELETRCSVKVTHWMPLPREQSREVQTFLNKKMRINNNPILGVDLAVGPDISVETRQFSKHCKGCDFDGPSCSNPNLCIKDAMGYYTGYRSTKITVSDAVADEAREKLGLPNTNTIPYDWRFKDNESTI